MAEDSGNEDQWLYGDSNLEPPEIEQGDETKVDAPENNIGPVVADDTLEEIQEQVAVLEPPLIPPVITLEAEGRVGSGEDEDAQLQIVIGDTEPSTQPAVAVVEDDDDEDDDDDSDDDVRVVIGDIKTSPTYTSLNIKRGGLLTSAAGGEKLKQPGKFSIEEFEAVGTINGVAAHEYNLDSLDEKPWRKPGADITDYFNYGFNEETWRAYCERQKRLRIHESGVGLAQLSNPGTGRGIIPVAITNDNSKYSGFMGPKKAGPPPGRKMGGTIDVIGAGGLASRRNLDKSTPPKENVIQVMTADRREYSRKPGFPDLSVPPPPAGIPSTFDLPPPNVIPPLAPPFQAPPHPHIETYGGEFYTPEGDPYYQSYEPTQDLQWNDPVSTTINILDVKGTHPKTTWQPTPGGSSPDVKTVLPLANLVTPLPPIIPPLKSSIIPLGIQETSNQDSQDAFSSRGSVRDHSEELPGGITIKEEPGLKEASCSDKEGKERDRRERSERHRERAHRHRSRSRSVERRARRRKSRSRSPGHRSHRKKKSRRAEREKSKEESE